MKGYEIVTSGPDLVGDWMIKLLPTTQSQVCATVALAWRYGRDYPDELRLRDIWDAMAALATEHPEVIERIKREVPTQGPLPEPERLTDFLPPASYVEAPARP